MLTTAGRAPKRVLAGALVAASVVAGAAAAPGGSSHAATSSPDETAVLAELLEPASIATAAHHEHHSVHRRTVRRRDRRTRREPTRRSGKKEARRRARAKPRAGRTSRESGRRAVEAVHVARRTPVSSSYAPGVTGFDISMYQCGDVPGHRAAIAVVQVSDGALAGGPNPCYVREAHWAGAHLSDYIFMDGYGGRMSAAALRGPEARCAVRSVVCRAYDFGWNWSRRWVLYAERRRAVSTMWWLDVETTGTWGRMRPNQAVVQGAVAGLRSEHKAVGIYSTPYQWHQIVGRMEFPGVALWTPGAGNATGPGDSAVSFCRSPSESFAGGHIAMVQWGYTGSFPGAYGGSSAYDLDYSC